MKKTLTLLSLIICSISYSQINADIGFYGRYLGGKVGVEKKIYFNGWEPKDAINFEVNCRINTDNVNPVFGGLVGYDLYFPDDARLRVSGGMFAHTGFRIDGEPKETEKFKWCYGGEIRYTFWTMPVTMAYGVNGNGQYLTIGYIFQKIKNY